MSFFSKHKTVFALNFSAIILFAMMVVLQSATFDQGVFVSSVSPFAHTITGRLADFMLGITDTLSPSVLILLTLVFSAVLVYKKKVSWALFFAGSMFFAMTTLVVLKSFFEIARPVNQVIPEIGWSFPSGHATAVSVFFFSILYAVEEKIDDSAIVALWALVSLGLVIITGFSRIYLGVHWVSDVFAGFALGTFWVTLAILVLERSKEHATESTNS